MSVATVRLIPIVPAVKVVAAANAHPATAGVLLVLTTLTAEIGEDAVTELANTHMMNVMNHLVLSNLYSLLLAHYFSPA